MKFNNDMLRLYAVTDRHWTGEQTLYEQVRDVLMGGATCLQLREKDLDEALSMKKQRILKNYVVYLMCHLLLMIMLCLLRK